MHLIWLDVGDLIGAAGGDPWAVNQSLQAGNPFQISQLAEAFHAAGRCSAEADHAFDQARLRFDAAWNHRNGDHPINGSAEVQRLTKTLGLQSDQLPKIGTDLEGIAGTLAAAQRDGTAQIAALERQLGLLDRLVGAARKDLEDPALDATSRAQLRSLIADAKADAADDTRDALRQLTSIRDTYTRSLRLAQATGNLTPQDATLVGQFKPAGFGDGQGPPPADPRITGPAGTPQHEQNVYDLQDQFQDGQGPTFGGDPRDGFPRSPASQLAQGPPGTRPLPTGTALGPDGHRYAFFSNPDGTDIPGFNQYATNGSVWDFTDPNHPVSLGDLPGIFQASGAYDPATKQMVIVGNTSNRVGDTNRGLWVSAPIDPAKPNGWVNSLQRVGDVSLPGDRESQLVALQGGGFMLVGATEFGPVQGIAAATPQGLTSAAPVTLMDQDRLPSVYGPTVTGTSLNPATGLETIQLRLSTWPGGVYDPNTWTTTFDVQH
ncbi:putative alpha/beta hydrolase [Mycobacterium sp. 050134]|uniref:putative alpha/beta hydrolase n=1 Tax=Mycobacterium sp. 050134 TaxID=3096111 RepID=UPI002ED8DC6E